MERIDLNDLRSAPYAPLSEQRSDPSIPPAEYCPVSIGARLVADRWTLLIVHQLLNGAAGFNELRRRIPGLSRSILTSRLRHLERLGVIDRERAASSGCRHRYRLTAAGRALGPIVAAVAEWTASWRSQHERQREGGKGPDSELEQSPVQAKTR